MKKLSAEKRNQLTLSVLGTLAIVSMVYIFLIGPQDEQNKKLETDAIELKTKLNDIKKAIKQADETEKSSTEMAQKLAAAESDIASGDVFAWVYDNIRRFKANYDLNIPNIGQPDSGDVKMLNDFPYKNLSVTLQGTGYFHDIGKFVADLENNFPHVRVINLILEPGSDQDAEKLSFRMGVVTLTKTTE